MAEDGDVELAIVYLEEVQEYTRCTTICGQPLSPEMLHIFEEMHENVDSAISLLRKMQD